MVMQLYLHFMLAYIIEIAMKYNLLFDPMLLTLQHYATEMPRVSSEHSSSSKGTGHKTFLRSILFPILHFVFGQKCYVTM